MSVVAFYGSVSSGWPVSPVTECWPRPPAIPHAVDWGHERRLQQRHKRHLAACPSWLQQRQRGGTDTSHCHNSRNHCLYFTLGKPVRGKYRLHCIHDRQWNTVACVVDGWLKQPHLESGWLDWGAGWCCPPAVQSLIRPHRLNRPSQHNHVSRKPLLSLQRSTNSAINPKSTYILVSDIPNMYIFFFIETFSQTM